MERGAGRPGFFWELQIVVAVITAGLLLRLHDYRSIPWRAPNLDEWDWAWVGLSQLLGKPPTAWTLFKTAYPESVWAAPPAPYTLPLVHPWVDHPPLFGWLVGLIAWLDGDRTVLDVVNDPQPRLLGIALSVVAMALAYVLGRLVFGRWPALAGVGLLATAPIPVVLDRLVAAEQLLAVLLLVALIAVHLLRRDPHDRRWLWLLLATCAIAPAVKAPGLVVGASAVLLLASARQLRLAAYALAATLGAQLAVLGYEAAVNWPSYVAEIGLRGSQLSGLTGYKFITDTTGFDGQQALDGWWLLGWIGLAELVASRQPEHDLIAAPPVLYLLMMLGTAAVYSSGYGWYRITVMPLIYLAAGRFLWLAAWELSWMRLGIAAALAIATLANWAEPLHLRLTAVVLGAAVAVAILPALIALARPQVRALARGAALVLVGTLIPIGVLEVANLAYIYGAR